MEEVEKVKEERRGLGGVRRFCTPVVLCLLLVPLSSLFAFDSADWLGKREVFAREAERLRAAWSNCMGRVSAPAENVTIPVEAFDDGSVKTRVNAAKAQYFLKEGLVWAEGVEVVQHAADGTVEGRIEAATCVVDRNSRSGWAEGAAKVTHGKTVFSGSGVYFSAAESYVQVFGDSRVESDEIRFERSAKKAAAGVFRGRSVRSDFDAKAGVALFEGAVCAKGSDGTTMCADRVYLFLAGTNDLKRAVAVGDVSITNGVRVGTCAMATYRRAKGEVEMFGDGKEILARLTERGEDVRSLEGTRIKFWIESEQVEVDNSKITAERKGGESLL